MNPLDALLKQTATAQRVIGDATLDIQDILSKAAGITQDSAGIAQTAATDAALIVQTEQAAKLSTQAAVHKAGAAFGTNMLAQDEVISLLAEQAKVSFNKQQELKKVIDQKNQVSFFKDPLNYLVNQITIQEDIIKHNAAVDAKDAAFEQLKELNAATQASVTTQKLFEASVTEASAAAAARNAAAVWKVKANEATLQGFNTNISGIQAAVQATKEQLDLSFKARGAIIDEEQLALQRRASARADEELSLRRAAMAKEDKYDSLVIDQINAGRAARGLPALSGVQTNAVLSAIKSKGDLGDEMRADWKTGERVMMDGTVQLASSMSGLYARLKSGHAMKLPSEQQQLVNRLVEAGDAAMERITKNPMYDKKDVQGTMALLDKELAKVIYDDAREVRPGDKQNLFQIAPLQTIAKYAPASANTFVWKEFLAPRVAAGEDFSDPTKVMAALANGIRQGKLNYKQAIEVTTLYQQGVAINNETKSFKKFGVEPVYAYNTRITVPGFITGYEHSIGVVDLTKPDVVGRVLSKMLAVEAAGGSEVVREIKSLGGIKKEDLAFGPELTNTPEKYDAGRKVLGDMLRK